MKHAHVLICALLLGACANSPGGGGPDAGASCEEAADCADDGLYCNGGVVCRDGACIPTDPPNCADGINCTADECNESLVGCVNIPHDDLCDEGLACIEGEGCGTPVACEFTTDCQDDAILCNGTVECVDSLCTSVPPNCADSDACTNDQCVEGTGCVTDPYDWMNDVDHCTAACIPCPAPGALQVNVERLCSGGVCSLVCASGFWDVDLNMANGCEVGCASDPFTTPDSPDDGFLDTNCDGIDGHFTQIFVSLGGNDGWPGTRAQPARTLIGAFSKVTATRTQIYVSEGDYFGRLTLVDGVSIYGGYSANTSWTRSASFTTTFSATSPADGRMSAVEGYNILTPTTFDRIEVVTSDTTGGASNYAFYCNNCDGLTIKNSTLDAGNGGNGSAGGGGSTGTGGVNGTGGNNGSCDGGRGLGGGGGQRTCSGGTSVSGGGGGDGGNEGANDGGGGGGGNNGGGSAGTAGPAGSCSCPFSCAAGGGGDGGSPSAPGAAASGSGGDGGTGSSGFWVGDAGNAGNPGSHGRGGGGGGGGGGQGGGCVDDGGGNGGGGGGSGGCGGTAGGGATAGGGTFGLFLVNSTGITVTNNTIQSGTGGTGGTGGSGGGGGGGGSGMNGATACTGEVGRGGNGGDGSDGGQAGHGGGGEGGASYAVFRVGTTVSTGANALNLLPYAGGNGGTSPGSAASDGDDGPLGTVN